ncbi:hypothetical protein ONZ51_g6165 [Trametes cubensis]|uniref:F-box domain-containing protein n=1 Tax=Trametes cubensis TaxID=1111947 RepID=A0AAD7TUR8_9APHY|nr:hypothetical protein ONZ51_g6165 [Trametes cubensis]
MAYRHPPSTFPTEIYEEIIGWADLSRLWSHQEQKLSIKAHRTRRATLYSCALACRAWLPTSRACLYQHLTIFSTDRVLFEHLVRSLSTNSNLRTLIRTISVIDTHKDSVTRPEVPGAKRVGDIAHTWPVILAGQVFKLPCLHTINITLIDGLTRYQHYTRSLRTFNTLTTLSLVWSSAGSFADLVRLIATFPNLRSLSLKAEYWVPKGPHILKPPRQLPPLSQLTIVDSPNLSHDVWGEVNRILLQAVAGSIKILDIPLACIPKDLADYDTIELSCLETVRVRVDYYPNSEWHDGVDWVLRSASDVGGFWASISRETAIERLTGRMRGILTRLSTTAIITKITLLLAHDVRGDVRLHTLYATEAAAGVQKTLLSSFNGRDERWAEIKLIWSGLTEELNGVHLMVADLDSDHVEVSYVPPLELAHYPVDWVALKRPKISLPAQIPPLLPPPASPSLELLALLRRATSLLTSPHVSYFDSL